MPPRAPLVVAGAVERPSIKKLMGPTRSTLQCDADIFIYIYICIYIYTFTLQ